MPKKMGRPKETVVKRKELAMRRDSREIAHLYFAKAWSIEKLAYEYSRSTCWIRKVLSVMRQQYGKQAAKVMAEARAIQVEQVIELARTCIEKFETTGNPELVGAFAKAYGTLSSSDRPAPNLTQVNVEATGINNQVIEIQEVEDWYGEHSAKAHSLQADSSAIAKAVAAHARRFATPREVQSDLLRENVVEDSNEHADDFAGARAAEGVLAGSVDEAEGGVPLDGDDARTGQEVYMGVDHEGNPVHMFTEE